MPRSPDALINPQLLIWARESSGYSLELAAEKASVKVERLRDWEAGQLFPTIKQLKTLANIYKQPFAAFYLPVAPPVFKPPQRDLRLLYGHAVSQSSPEVVIETRFALERREIYIELKRELAEEVPSFQETIDSQIPPPDLAERFRQLLQVTDELQLSWSDDRVAFNSWRACVESAGVLVFQTSKIPIEEMRGSSIYFPTCPIILLNRKEAYLGRLFTLIHELTHISLRSRVLCDPDPDHLATPEQREIEKYCDAVSANTIAPSSLVTSQLAKIKSGQNSLDVEFADIETLSRSIGASRQVIVRRLAALNIISPREFRRHESTLQRLLAMKGGREPGPIKQHVDRASIVGKPLVRAVMDAYRAEKITSSDASDYLGLKTKHFRALELDLATR